jgi:predicted O-methyltransferase YrrM
VSLQARQAIAVSPGAGAVLAELYAEPHLEDPRDPAGPRLDVFPTSIPVEHAVRLAEIVRDAGLMRTLETGMAYGLSTLAIAGAHAARGSGRHVAIDPIQSTKWRSLGRAHVRRAGIEDFVTVIEQRSDEALPRLSAAGEELDLAFIDGHHLFDYTLVDFFYADRMLVSGGVVAFHDPWIPAVGRVVDFVRTNRAYEVLSADGGLALLEKIGSDERDWDDHRDF